MKRLLVALCLLLAPVAFADEAPSSAPAAGSFAVATWTGSWTDLSRSRNLPVKIYYPADASGKAFPVIIFSHGLGGSRDGYAYLGEYWAAHGYISVHVQHPGSDSEVMAGAGRPLAKLRKLKAAATDPANLTNRPKDITFTIDQLARVNRDGSFPLHGMMDLEHLAVAGHSFGAYTVLAVAGQAIGPDRALVYFGPDPRIKAAIAMSSQRAHTANPDDAYARIKIPIFHMTGTKDQSPIGERGNESEAIVGSATVADRRMAYDHTKNAPAYLLTFKDGDHMVFSGRPRQTVEPHDQAYQKLVCEASTAFWDARLKGNAAAGRWLDQGGFAALLGDSGVFERK